MLNAKALRESGEKILDHFDRKFYTDLGRRFRNRRLGVHRNDYSFRPDQLAFVHLPKTGGTSLNTILRDDADDRFTGVFRHRPISRKCPPGSYNYFTVMRDPVERVWSFYQMSQRSLARGGGPYGHVAGRGLEFFLRHCWEVRNMACRYYSGELVFEPKAATLERAWRNLELFRYVLCFETLSQDAGALLADCGLSVHSLPHENRHPYEGPGSEDEELIRRFNDLDVEIHRRWMARVGDAPGSGRRMQ